MTVISMLNRKGGTGKTTASINLSSIMALKKKKKVLLIDLDPQANASTYLDVYVEDGDKYVGNILCDDLGIDEVVQGTNIKNFYLIPSHSNLDDACDVMADMPSKEYILKNKLKEVENEYDYVFIDCPPGRNTTTVNALVASDYTILPCEASEFGVDSITAMNGFIVNIQRNFNSELKIAGILFPKRENTKVQDMYANHIKRNLGYPAFKTDIRKTTIVDRSLNAHEPLIIFDPKAAVTKDYEAVANEIEKIIKGGKK